MTNFTPAQLEAWAGLGRLNWWSDGEITDLNGKSIGLVAFEGAEYLTAFAAAPDLARLVLEKEKEIARLRAALKAAEDKQCASCRHCDSFGLSAALQGDAP